MQHLASLMLALTVLTMMAFVIPQSAQAGTAANTVIRNTATVSYDDTAGNAMPEVTGTVDITVSMVYATATLSAPDDETTSPGTAAEYSYTITSNANGPDSYTLSATIDSESAGISGSTAETSVASVTLGATTAAAAVSSGNASITVPNDGTSDSSINGIVADDIVVIGGNAYTVQSITDNGSTVSGTSTITLTSNLTTDVSAGDAIYERKTFTMTVTPGTVTTATDKTIAVTTSAEGTTAAAATDSTTTTVNVATITVTKHVSSDGTNWYLTADNRTFAPSATIYYRITVTNSGSSNATSVVLTDAQPAYTTYVTDSARYAVGAAVNYGAASALTDAAGGDDLGDYDFNVTTADTATYSIGTIAPGAGNAVQLFFTVTVN
jgi:uncharacterized repeat protein (TIGR01451 family)